MQTKIWFSSIIFITIFTFTGFIYYSLLQRNPKEISQEAIQGKKVWGDYGCAECHTILGNGGYMAGDLTNIVTQQDTEWLKFFFIRPPFLSSNKHHVKLNDTETKYMLEYLHLVNKINTLGWSFNPKKKPIILKIKRVDEND